MGQWTLVELISSLNGPGVTAICAKETAGVDVKRSLWIVARGRCDWGEPVVRVNPGFCWRATACG